MLVTKCLNLEDELLMSIFCFIHRRGINWNNGYLWVTQRMFIRSTPHLYFCSNSIMSWEIDNCWLCPTCEENFSILTLRWRHSRKFWKFRTSFCGCSFPFWFIITLSPGGLLHWISFWKECR
jgi:hypothetical protein